MLRKLLIIASTLLTLAVTVPVAQAAVDASACGTAGNGVTCFSGKKFCPANNSCYDPTTQAACGANTHWDCNACACVCDNQSGSCSTGPASATCYKDSETNTTKVGVYTGSCSNIACPSGRSFCSTNNTCRTNRNCPTGTVWDVCTDVCSTPYILQNPSAAQSVSNDLTFTGNTTVNGNETVKGMFSLGATGLNVGAGQNGFYQVVAGGSSGSLMLLQTFSGGTYSDRFRVDASGNVTAPAFVGNGAGLTSVVAGDIVAGTHSNAVNFSNGLNSFAGNFTATGGNKFNGDGTGLTGVCLTTGTGCPSGSSTWTRTGTNVALTNIGDNVGIGTASPTSKLEVAGKVALDNSGAAVADNSPFVMETAADTQNGGTTALYVYPRDSANHRMFFGKPGLPLFSLNLANVGGWESFPGFISPTADFTVYTSYGKSIFLRHSPTNGSFIYPAVAGDDLNSLGYFHFKSNQNDVGAAAQAYVLDTTLNRTAGNLLDVRNNGVSKFSIANNGNANVVGNLTVTGTVTSGGSGMISGGGTIGRVPKFTGVSAVGNSVIFDDGTNIGIGTTIPTAMLDVRGNMNISSSADGLNVLATGAGSSGITAQVTSLNSTAISGQSVGANNTGVGVMGSNNNGVAASYGVEGTHTNSAAYAGYFLNSGNGKYAKFGGPNAGTFNGDVQVTGNLTATATITANAFTGIGTNLTALNATNLASGTVGTARLGTGTANATTFLRGDGTWATASFTDTDTLQTVVARGNTTNTYIGVNGAAANAGYGVASQGSNGGVYGTTATTQSALVAGVVGVNTSGTTGYGVYGSSAGNGGVGLYGTGGSGVIGNATFATGSGGFFTNSALGGVSAMLATQQGGVNYAGYFQGNTYVNGNETITGSLTAGSISVGSCVGCGGLSGGVNNTIPKWTGASSQGSSQITDDGTLLGINGTSAAAKFAIQTAAQQEALYAANTYVADSSTIKYGVYGQVSTTNVNSAGLAGSGPNGVYGTNFSSGNGVFGTSTSGRGVYGLGSNSTSSGGYFANGGNGTYAQLATQIAGANYAGYFSGDVRATGTIAGGGAPAIAGYGVYGQGGEGVVGVSNAAGIGGIGANGVYGSTGGAAIGDAGVKGVGITGVYGQGTTYSIYAQAAAYGFFAGSGSTYSFYGTNGTLYNGGDIDAPNNTWGAGNGWYYCTTGSGSWSYCTCANGSFVANLAFSGTQAATYCYKP